MACVSWIYSVEPSAYSMAQLHFERIKLGPTYLDCREASIGRYGDFLHAWQTHKNNMISFKFINFRNLRIKTTTKHCMSMLFLDSKPFLYLYPVRGWHYSCHSLCPQIQWHVAWEVSSQWSGCVRSWWGVAGSESTGWRSGSVLRQDQLWQCVWQWDLVETEWAKCLWTEVYNIK